MEFTKKEQRILKCVDSFDESNWINRAFFALTKYSSFVVVMFLLFAVVFQGYIEEYPFAFGILIFALMIYEMKGREYAYFKIIKKLRSNNT